MNSTSIISTVAGLIMAGIGLFTFLNAPTAALSTRVDLVEQNLAGVTIHAGDTDKRLDRIESKIDLLLLRTNK